MNEAIYKASGLITVNGSKDYLDLQILIGDFYIVKNDWEAAKGFFDTVINGGYDKDYERSIMKARALLRRGYAYFRCQETAFAQADVSQGLEMYKSLGDQLGIAEARWASHVVAGDIPKPIFDKLRKENVQVRVSAIDAYKEALDGAPKEVIARRSNPSDLEINKLIGVARNHVVRSSKRRS